MSELQVNTLLGFNIHQDGLNRLLVQYRKGKDEKNELAIYTARNYLFAPKFQLVVRWKRLNDLAHQSGLKPISVSSDSDDDYEDLGFHGYSQSSDDEQADQDRPYRNGVDDLNGDANCHREGRSDGLRNAANANANDNDNVYDSDSNVYDSDSNYDDDDADDENADMEKSRKKKSKRAPIYCLCKYSCNTVQKFAVHLEEVPHRRLPEGSFIADWSAKKTGGSKRIGQNECVFGCGGTFSNLSNHEQRRHLQYACELPRIGMRRDHKCIWTDIDPIKWFIDRKAKKDSDKAEMDKSSDEMEIILKATKNLDETESCLTDYVNRIRPRGDGADVVSGWGPVAGADFTAAAGAD
ncbi:hypothetical protein B0T24DRAFT_683516 [Lasiosphaeria ovina]|uniref:Uncharacterized protein n=1 Tax=Lasiosphaeria ovina TaxID=92902 RepID=A0AAE0MZR6_9PEZI|nr:hypothetical protein B0T24DRAFT_683516 [Lasiosphaeria ovina]